MHTLARLMGKQQTEILWNHSFIQIGNEHILPLLQRKNAYTNLQ